MSKKAKQEDLLEIERNRISNRRRIFSPVSGKPIAISLDLEAVADLMQESRFTSF